MEAVRFGDTEVCQLLLDRGAEAEKRGARGLSALDLAWPPGPTPGLWGSWGEGVGSGAWLSLDPPKSCGKHVALCPTRHEAR